MYELSSKYQEMLESHDFKHFSLLDLKSESLIPHVESLKTWLSKNYHGSMSYMEKHPRDKAETILESAKSALIVLFPYAQGMRRNQESLKSPVLEKIGKYAHYQDYHSLIRKSLRNLGRDLSLDFPDLQFRPIADSAPFLERATAQLAGLGFFGKNTLLIKPGRGSFFLIGTLFLSIPASSLGTPSQPHSWSGCGSCTRCLDACPTNAFPEAFTLDARKCLSYLTIEYKGIVPNEYLPHYKETFFGCDICQNVCPYNQVTSSHIYSKFNHLNLDPDLKVEDIAMMNQQDFKTWFHGSPLLRATYPGLVRNALYHLYSIHSPFLRTILEKRMEDPEPLIKEVVNQLMQI